MKLQHNWVRRLLAVTSLLLVCVMLFAACAPTVDQIVETSKPSEQSTEDTSNSDHDHDHDHGDSTDHVHQWSDWSVTTDPTCEEQGEESRTCSCGKTEKQAVDAKGHCFENRICTMCGYLDYTKGLYYELNGDGTCCISSNYFCSDTEIYIPEYIDGYKVTSIGEEAFYRNDKVTSITIPNSVTSIGKRAFAHCKNLASVNIPDGITTISTDAFFDCESLTSIIIPASVTIIEVGAFKYCSGLTSVNILGDSLEVIDDGAFEYCEKLTSINIPNNVRYIGQNAFSRCYSLTSITIPKKATHILMSTFSYCKSLTSVSLSYNIISIGNSAFIGCTSLSSINITYKLKHIDNRAFEECENLESIYLTGATSDWYAIEKDNAWDSQTGDYTIYCANGNITKLCA